MSPLRSSRDSRFVPCIPGPADDAMANARRAPDVTQ